MLMLHKLSTNFAYAADGKRFADRFNLCNRRWRYPISLSWDQENRVYICRDGDNEIRVTRKERVQRYFHGINFKLKRLAIDDYLLRSVPLAPDDLVIDCGANVGEIGKFLRETRGCRVVSIEPDPDEFRSLCANNPNNQNYNVALWESDGELPFYRKNATGDSSLFAPPGDFSLAAVRTTTLAQLMSEAGIARVKLLKLEAEGAEPEILRGAKDRLEDIDYISADVGPERGIREDATAVPVINYLLSRGFELVDMTFDRVVCLFRRRGLAES
jgi:FkbM family methyltransferase